MWCMWTLTHKCKKKMHKHIQFAYFHRTVPKALRMSMVKVKLGQIDWVSKHSRWSPDRGLAEGQVFKCSASFIENIVLAVQEQDHHTSNTGIYFICLQMALPALVICLFFFPRLILQPSLFLPVPSHTVSKVSSAESVVCSWSSAQPWAHLYWSRVFVTILPFTINSLHIFEDVFLCCELCCSYCTLILNLSFYLFVILVLFFSHILEVKHIELPLCMKCAI